jgi:predicted RNase H-like HicB family nuclease
MKHKSRVIVSPLKEGGFIARCQEVRATAMGDTPDEAMQNMREAINEMITEYGEAAVFQDVVPESQVQLIELAV